MQNSERGSERGGEHVKGNGGGDKSGSGIETDRGGPILLAHSAMPDSPAEADGYEIAVHSGDRKLMANVEVVG